MDMGNDITFQDVETIFKQQNPSNFQDIEADPGDDEIAEAPAGYFPVRQGNKIIGWIKPPEAGNDPFPRGHNRELISSEKYPTFRWNFEWSKFVVIGLPDGITDKFVYEFKSTKKRLLFNKALPFAQADLY